MGNGKKKNLPKWRWNFEGQEKQYRQLSRKEDEDSLHDIYSVEKESDKKPNKLEKGEINSETEMDEISEGNKVSKVEIDEKVKGKKNKAL